MADKWKVVAEPHGKNPGFLDKAKAAVGATGAVTGENQGGVIIYVQHPDGRKEEVSRVGWIRRHTKNPKVTFDKQLATELDKARKSVEVLNSLGDAAGVLQ